MAQKEVHEEEEVEVEVEEEMEEHDGGFDSLFVSIVVRCRCAIVNLRRYLNCFKKKFVDKS